MRRILKQTSSQSKEILACETEPQIAASFDAKDMIVYFWVKHTPNEGYAGQHWRKTFVLL